MKNEFILTTHLVVKRAFLVVDQYTGMAVIREQLLYIRGWPFEIKSSFMFTRCNIFLALDLREKCPVKKRRLQVAMKYFLNVINIPSKFDHNKSHKKYQRKHFFCQGQYSKLLPSLISLNTKLCDFLSLWMLKNVGCKRTKNAETRIDILFKALPAISFITITLLGRHFGFFSSLREKSWKSPQGKIFPV